MKKKNTFVFFRFSRGDTVFKEAEFLRSIDLMMFMAWYKEGWASQIGDSFQWP